MGDMADRSGNDASTHLPRARRFAIRMPLRHRVSGQINWHEGKTENISRSGLLFRGEHLVEPKTLIEMSFVLPVEVFNQPAAEVICSGLVVRTEPPSGTSRSALGAKILDYYFLRRRGEPAYEGLGRRMF